MYLQTSNRFIMNAQYAPQYTLPINQYHMPILRIVPRVYHTQINQDGFHEVKYIEKVRDINNSICDTPLNIVGDDNSVTLYIAGKRVLICKKWYEHCMVPLNERTRMEYCNHNQDNTHLHLNLCHFYLLYKRCKNGASCKHFHADKNTMVQTQINMDKTKTSMCMKYLLYKYNNNNPCTFQNCKYAHNINDIKINSEIAEFDKLLLDPLQKIPLQELYTSIYNIVTDNKSKILDLYTKNNKGIPTFFEPIPKYFKEYLEIFSYSIYLARRDGQMDFVNNAIKCKYYQGLNNRIRICETDLECQYKIMMGQQIKYEDVCNHGMNCNSGVHIGLANQICLDDLVGNCTCKIKSTAHADEMKQQIKLKLIELKNEKKTLQEQLNLSGDKKAISIRIDFTTSAIRDKTREFLKTYRKIHLVTDYNYEKLREVTFEDKLYSGNDYYEMSLSSLESLSSEARIEYYKKQDEHNKRLEKFIQDQKIKKEQKEQEHKLHLESIYTSALELSKTSSEAQIWFESDAWKIIPFNRFDINKEFYLNWKKNSLGCSYDSFVNFAKKQMDIWDNNYINNYRNVWMYIYNIPVDRDPEITDGLENIIESNPELWCEYKEKFNYRKTFKQFIEEDEQLAQALVLYSSSKVGNFTNAIKYIKNNIKDTNISYDLYCMYDNHTIVMWKEINIICNNNQMKIITIDDFINDKANYIDFYIRSGRYTYGTSEYGYQKFLDDKKEGWRICHHSMKQNDYSSLLALSMDHLKEFFKKNSVWSIDMMRKHCNYTPMLIYTLNSKAGLLTIFTTVIDSHIKDLYNIISSPSIQRVINDKTIIDKQTIDSIAQIKLLLDEINNPEFIMNNLCSEFESRSTELKMLKLHCDPNSMLLQMARNVLVIFANVKGKRELANLKVKPVKVIVNNDSDDSDSDDSDDSDSDDSDDSDSDDSDDSDSDDEEDDNFNSKMNFKRPDPLFELMPRGYDFKLYIKNEHPNDILIDKNSTCRKVYFGPFEEKDVSMLNDLVSKLKDSRFGKGSNLGVDTIKLDKEGFKSSWHLTVNDRKISSKSNRHKAKEDRQDTTEDAYGYDWLADMFVNIINKTLNINVKEVLTNIFTLEARIEDHVNRQNREIVKRVISPVVKKVVKQSLSKEEKTAMIRAKLEAKKAIK